MRIGGWLVGFDVPVAPAGESQHAVKVVDVPAPVVLRVLVVVLTDWGGQQQPISSGPDGGQETIRVFDVFKGFRAHEHIDTWDQSDGVFDLAIELPTWRVVTEQGDRSATGLGDDGGVAAGQVRH